MGWAVGSWIVWDEVGLLQCWSVKQERRGSARASFVAAPMPKSVSFWEKRRSTAYGMNFLCVSLCISVRTFYRWGGLVFIVDVVPVGW